MPNWVKKRTTMACVSVCLLSILMISFFPVSFGVGPYCTVHGPLHQVGSQSDWNAVVACWTDPELSALLLSIACCLFRSMNLQSLILRL